MFAEQEGKRREARRSQGDNEEYFSRRIVGQAVGEPRGHCDGCGEPSGPTAKTRREKADTERGLWMSDRRRRWGGQGPRSHQRRAKSGQTFTPPRGSRAGSCAGVQPSCDHGVTGVRESRWCQMQTCRGSNPSTRAGSRAACGQMVGAHYHRVERKRQSMCAWIAPRSP
jgi:hypothetical protein